MARKFNLKSKSLWKKIGLVALSCALFVGSIAGLSALFKKSEETTKEINPTYSVGALNATTGKYEETKSAIYTKDGFECQGLTTSLEFDAVVKYQLYFYNEYDDFIHTTGTLDGVFYSTGVPSYAKYVRVVIIPNEDEDISWLEKFKYANQLNIKANKEQNFKSFGKNLFVVEHSNKGLENDGVTISQKDGFVVSEKISVGNNKHSLFISLDTVNPDNYMIYFYSADGSFLRYGIVNDIMKSVYNVSTGKSYLVCDISSDIGYIRINCPDKASSVEVYMY